MTAALVYQRPDGPPLLGVDSCISYGGMSYPDDKVMEVGGLSLVLSGTAALCDAIRASKVQHDREEGPEAYLHALIVDAVTRMRALDPDCSCSALAVSPEGAWSVDVLGHVRRVGPGQVEGIGCADVLEAVWRSSLDLAPDMAPIARLRHCLEAAGAVYPGTVQGPYRIVFGSLS